MPVTADSAVQRVFWDTPVLQQTEQALNRSAARHRVLAHNLANVNTPGYQRRDIPFETYLQDAETRQHPHTMRTTDPRHYSHSPGIQEALLQPNSSGENLLMRTDGSTVDPDMEMASLAENELRYAALTRIASGGIRSLMTAITGGR